MFGFAALALSACGSGGGHFANRPEPASPVNVTVYINDHRVSISPTRIGAGPVVFVVTNQASNAESLTVLPAGSSAGQALADTGPISPQGTTQVTITVNNPGDYAVAISPNSQTQAAAATPTGIRPALLHVGSARRSAGNQLLQP
jgi:hypothetical protein